MGLWTDHEPRNGASYEWLHAPARVGGDKSQAPAPPPPKPPRRRWRVLLAAAGLAGVFTALIVIATVALVDDGTPKNQAAVSPLAVSKSKTGTTRTNEIYAKVSSSVVSIQVKTATGAGSGTGFVISGDGTVVTNDHVVEDATQVQVRFDDHSQPVTARVVGTDPSSDLAVLHVDPGKAPAPMKPLTLADSDNVAVGDNAIAIGFPLGLDRTATRASSPASSAPSRRPTTSRSTTSCRRTRRSTPATRAARCSTTAAA